MHTMDAQTIREVLDVPRDIEAEWGRRLRAWKLFGGLAAVVVVEIGLGYVIGGGFPRLF